MNYNIVSITIVLLIIIIISFVIPFALGYYESRIKQWIKGGK